MAVSTLALTLFDLRTTVSRFLGFNPAYASCSASEQSVIDAAIRRGLLRFYFNADIDGQIYQWSFLKPTTTIDTIPDYATGTISSVGAVVTLVGGTWPSWAVDHGSLVVSDETFTILSVDSATQITLSAAPTVDFPALTTFVLQYDNRYDLPDDFGNMIGGMSYPQGAGYRSLERISEAEIRSRESGVIDYSVPKAFAIRPQRSTGAGGQKWEAMFWPRPDAAYHLTYRYEITPDLVTASTPYLQGSAQHSLTIETACLSEAERIADDTAAIHSSEYMTLLRTSVQRDSTMAPDYMGINSEPRFGGNYLPVSRSNIVTYNNNLP